MKLKVDRLKRNQSGLRSGLLDYTILYLVLPFQRHISRGSIKKKTQKPFVFFDPPSLVLLQKQTTEGGGKAVVDAIATIISLAFFGFSTSFLSPIMLMLCMVIGVLHRNQNLRRL